MRSSILVWLVVAAGLFSGCNSVMDRRISAHEDTWRGLSEQDRHRLVQGFVCGGDTESMVHIALGPPAKVLPLTSQDGQRLTVWLYEDLIDNWEGSPVDPNSSNHLTSRERRVIFQDGVVVDQAAIALQDSAKLVEFRVRPAAEHRVARLNSLVALTSAQKGKAYEIFAKAEGELLDLIPSERPTKGLPIRVKMRADIRAMLTTEQQAKFDAAPQYLGGGSTRRP